jgi:hypothetical protein
VVWPFFARKLFLSGTGAYRRHGQHEAVVDELRDTGSGTQLKLTTADEATVNSGQWHARRMHHYPDRRNIAAESWQCFLALHNTH